MKRFSGILFFLLCGFFCNAQTPSTCFRDWQHKPSASFQPFICDSNDVAVCYDDHYPYPPDDSLKGNVNMWFDIMDYYTIVGGCYAGPVYKADFLKISSAEKLPAGAVFCRLETYTYLKSGVMLSVHTGGFNEQDEICH